MQPSYVLLSAALLCTPLLAALTPEEALKQGGALLTAEHPGQAYELIAPVLEANPKNADLHELMGEILYRDGQIGPSEKEFKAAIQVQPDLARAWLGLGRVYWCASHRRTAALYFAKAHSLDPDDPAIVLAWTQILHGEEHINAMEAYLKMPGVDKDPEHLASVRSHIDLDRQLLGKKINQLVSPYQSMEVPLVPLMSDAHHLRGVGLSLSINGRKNITLLLDTGASGIVMRPKDAEKAGLESIHETFIRGVGDAGQRSASVAVASSVRVGSFELKNVPVEIAERKALADEDGLIGADVFERFLVTLDFSRSRLRLDPFPTPPPDEDTLVDRVISPAMQRFQPVFRFGHMLMVPVKLSGSRPYLFGLDTGASMTSISNEIAHTVSKVRGEEFVRLKGISGKVNDVYSADEIVLEFAGYRQKNVGMIAFQHTINPHPQTEMAGLLGFPLLHMFVLTIDYHDGLVGFEHIGR